MDQLTLDSQPTSEYRTIPLSQGQVAIVDAADYEWLSVHKWYATWCKTSRTFYAVRTVYGEGKKRHQVYMHREILGLKRGDRRQVDHENVLATLDNRRSSNLRISTHLQNKQNARATRQNTSGFIGVGIHSQTGAIIACISHNNKHIHIGCFKTKEAAARARDREAIRLRGKFARLNFPREDYGVNPS